MRSRPALFLTILLFLAAALGGCGTGTDSETAAGTETGSTAATGEVVVGLTDAQGDFLQYEVDVLSIRLTRADGAVVETLPLQTRIDFAELAEMTEFVTAQSVPLGRYVAASLTLDYGAAAVLVEDAEGVGVPPAGLLGPDGSPLGTLEMQVDMDRDHPLVIAPGVPAHLTLDFDLAATNEVTWSGAIPTVTVEPLLVADVGLEAPKRHRVRGPLLATDPARQSFTLGIRPLRALRRLGDRHLGRLPVATGDDTAFEVDGVAAAGEAGFALLAAKDALTAVAVVGDLERGPTWRFRAREVYAGSSVPGGELDGVTGTVLARAGDELTVKGAVLDRDGGVTLGATLAVSIAATTAFHKQGDPSAALDPTAVSVGQRITALGLYDAGAARLDATAGALRLLATHLTGTVAGAGQGELELSLQRIDGLRVDAAGFDFTGTGVDPASDADPAAYTLDTGTLSLAGIAAGNPVRAFGFVTPFGAAPPDFTATSVVALAQVRAHLRVGWTRGAGALAVAGDRITLDLTGAGPLHHVVRAGVATPLAATPSPTLGPAGDAGLYVLCRRSCTVYLGWDRFATGLQEALDEGASVRHLGADGTYDDASQTLAADRIRVSLR
jgi:hypothetical protein